MNFYVFKLSFHSFFTVISPEKRLKSISPCRKLFEDISTNQNAFSPNGFVVSNDHLTTLDYHSVYESSSNSGLRSSIGCNNNNFLNSTNQNGPFKQLNEKSCLDTDITVISDTLNKQQKQQGQFPELDNISRNIIESCNSVFINNNISNYNTNNNNNTTEALVVEGLSEILYSSYKRRGSLSLNLNLNNPSSPKSPFMNDLGFLSSINNHNYSDMTMNMMSSNENTTMASSLSKKNPLVIFENNSMGSDDVLLPSNPSSSLDIVNSSPMRKGKVPMIVRKAVNYQSNNSMHWRNRRMSEVNNYNHNNSIKPRRAMSECNLKVPISDNGLIHSIPCFDSPHDAIKRISPETLIDLLNGKHSKAYDRLFVIDCRYPYEFEGGHIPGAINVNDPETIENILLNSEELPLGHTLIVFHCEFSSERAPKMALHVRNLDRQLNKASYPSLFYPEMYILDGGYKNYWHQYGNLCDPPQSYLPMRNPKYRDQLRHYQKIKYAFKSGCHLSQHSGVKKALAPSKNKTNKSSARSHSLNVENARKFFNDRISQSQSQSAQIEYDSSFSVDDNENVYKFDGNYSSINNSITSAPESKHMFPSYTIPMKNSISSIYASDLDLASEIDD